MAIAHDAQTRFPTTDTTGFDTTTGTRTFTHTPVGTPAGVVVVINCQGTTAPVSGVLYDGVAMTLKTSAVDTSEAGSVWIYTLTDQVISSGAKTVTLQGCTSVNKWVTCSTVTSATGWSKIVGTGTKGTTTSASPTVNVVTTDTSLIYGGMHGGASDPTSYAAGSGYTTQFSGDYGVLSARTQRRTATVAAGTVAFNFTYTTSDDYCIAAVALAERAAPTTYYGVVARSITFGATVSGRIPGSYVSASDDFNRSDSTDLGSNWTKNRQSGSGTDLTIVSNALKVAVTQNNDVDAIFTGSELDGISADQFSQATLVATGGSQGGEQGAGLAVRANGAPNASRTQYRFIADGSSCTLSIFLNGVHAQLGTSGPGFADGDIMRLEANGSTITAYKNGTAVITVNNSGIASGRPGVAYSSVESGWPILDDWSGGDLVTGPVTRYGATAMSVTFGKDVRGVRKTFGQIVFPISFVEVTQGDVVAGPATRYGATSLSVTFGKDVRGQKKTFGQIARVITFGAITNGIIPGVGGYASDNFNRADESPIQYPWIRQTGSTGQIEIWTNEITKVSPGDCLYLYDEAAAADDQFSEIKLITKPTDNDWGVCCRVGGGTGNFSGYMFASNSVDGFVLGKFISPSWVVLQRATPPDTTVVGDVLRIEVEGQQIRGYVNGNLVISYTDGSAFYGGQPGLFWYQNNGRLDDWAGGDLVSGPVTQYGVSAMPVTFVKAVIGQRKTFSQVASPFTFVKEVIGQRKTFSQVAAPFTFIKEVIGQRKTFSQIAAPFTFTKSVIGQRKTFSQVAAPFTFVKSVIGQRKTFSQVATPFTFIKDVLGRKTTFGQTATSIVATIGISGIKVGKTLYGVVFAPFVFTKSVIGQRKTFSQVAASFTFVKAVIGQRKTFGQVTASFTFIKNVLGRKTTFGQTATSFIFTRVVSGARKTFGQITTPFVFVKNVLGHKTTFGQIVLPITFTKAVGGIRTTLGQIARPFIFTKSVSGTRKTFSRVDLPLIFVDQTSGRKQTFGQVEFPINIQIGIVAEFQGIRYGQASMSLVFHKDIAGTKKTFGQIVFPYFFSRSTQGVRKTFGRFDRPFTFTKATIGQRKTFGRSELPINTTIVVGGYRLVRGQVALSLVLGEQTTGRRKTFGKIATPYEFDAQLRGLRETFGLVDFPTDFIVDIKTGRVETYSSLGLEFLLSFETAGMVKPSDIILNLAKAIYLGSTPVDAVYTDLQKVWPKQ